MSESNSRFIKHAPCNSPDCSSSDGMAVYSDHTHCFACGKTVQFNQERQKGTSSRPLPPMKEILFEDFEEYRSLEKRTLELYSINIKQGHVVFQYRNENGHFCAQKIRAIEPDENGKRKTMWRGVKKEAVGFGMHLANPAKHDKLVICEGELDAPSVFQSFGGKIAAISVPDGAQSSPAFVRKHLDKFLEFKTIVIATDNDGPGDEAANKIMELFEPGRVRRAILPKKDSNEVLQTLGSLALKDAIDAAKEIRPDGIKSASAYAGLVLRPPDRTATDCCFVGWNKMSPFYDNQLIVLIAGSGQGKSFFARNLALGLMYGGHKVGWIGLEETAEESVFRFVGMAAGMQLHNKQSYADLTEDDMARIKQADKFITQSGQLELFDHFGSIDENTILNRMNYMVRSLGCKFMFLDHLTIISSGLAQDTRQVDSLVTKIRQFIAGTKCTVFAISHLNRSGDKNFENGDVPELHNIRSSHSIVQLADTIWALGRKRGSNKTESHCLKNRMSGRTGYAGSFQFDEHTQTLNETWDDPAFQ